MDAMDLDVADALPMIGYAVQAHSQELVHPVDRYLDALA